MKGAPAAPRLPPSPRGGAPRVLDAPARKRRSRPRALGSEPRRRAPLFLGKLGIRIADAFLASVAFLLIELLVVGARYHAEFITAGEALSAWRLVPVGVVVAAPTSLLVGALVEAIASSVRPMARVISALLAAAAVAATAAVVLPGALHGVGHLLAILAATGVAGFGVWFGAPRLAAWTDRAEPVARWAVALGIAAGGAIAGELASGLGGQGSARLAWCAVALAAAGFASLGRDPRAPVGKAAPIGAVLLFAAMAAIATPAVRTLAFADNVRRVYGAHAPALGRTLGVVDELAPPAVDAPAAMTPTPRRRDVVLVTLDALRADHVGAYGYDRTLTPAIDRLAQVGVVFEEAYTSTPDASFGAASILAGKRVRPLARLGLVGGDRPVGDTLATLLAHYGYATRAVYPSSLIDAERGTLGREATRKWGFEHAVVRDRLPSEVAGEVRAVLDERTQGSPLFLWVHIASPNAPYEPRERALGPRDVDRYDAEIAEADEAVGAVLDAVRAARPDALVVLTATSGEEFGDHGGHYHGTTVYEEQVRVPLVVAGPDIAPARVKAPVQTIDVLPTVLRVLGIPKPSRASGRDLGEALTGVAGVGFAFAETDTMSMVAEDAFRLVCFRRAGTCSLYNARRDAAETRDVTGNHPDVVAHLRALLAQAEASAGRYETRGGGDGASAWPDALRRGVAGDADAAADVATLLADPSVEIRRRAAEVLFDLERRETTAALKNAMATEEDAHTRAFIALALTRLGESAPLTAELLTSKDLELRRLAALALAEIGDDRGADELIRWWRRAFPDDPVKSREPIGYTRSCEILAAFARIKPKTAIVPILDALVDDTLRPVVAKALGDIGDEAARMPLSNRLLVESDRNTRGALLDALLRVKGGAEMVEPLVALLGMPDPLEHGLEAAVAIDMLQHVGGPQGDHDTARLRRFATSGVAVDFYIPRADVDEGVRVLCLARSDGVDGEIRVGRRIGYPTGDDSKAPVPKAAPELDPTRSMVIRVGASHQPVEVFGTAPASMDVHPGEAAHLVIYATQKVVIDACALVPLRSTLPKGRRRTD